MDIPDVFADKVVVLTGASSGIGQQLAQDLAKRKAVLHLIGRHAGRLQSITQSARELGAASALGHTIDFTDSAQSEEGTQVLSRALQKCDYLIHSAGVCTLGEVSQAPIESLDLNYQVNLRGPYLLTQALLPKLIAAKGQVVFINSGAGLKAHPRWSQYAASKHGLKAVADSLREEVGPKGVRVMSVYPGRTATPMQASVRQMEGKPYDPSAFVQVTDVSHMTLSALALPDTASVIDLNIRPGRRY